MLLLQCSLIEFDNFNMWGVDPQQEIRMVDQQAPQLVGQEEAPRPEPIPELLEPACPDTKTVLQTLQNILISKQRTTNSIV